MIVRIAAVVLAIVAILVCLGSAVALELKVKDGVSLNIRSGPGTKYPVRERVRPGSVLQQVSRNGAWIETNRGWAHSEFLEPFGVAEANKTAILFTGSGTISRPVEQATLSADGRTLATLHIPRLRERGAPYVQLWDVAASRQLYAIPFDLPVGTSSIADYRMSFPGPIHVDVSDARKHFRITLDVPSATFSMPETQSHGSTDKCIYEGSDYEISFDTIYRSVPGSDEKRVEWLWDKTGVADFYEFRCLNAPSVDRFLAVVDGYSFGQNSIVFLNRQGGVSKRLDLSGGDYTVAAIADDKDLVVLTNEAESFIELRRIDTGEKVFSEKAWGSKLAIDDEFVVFATSAKEISAIRLENLRRLDIDLSSYESATGVVGISALKLLGGDKALVAFRNTVVIADLAAGSVMAFLDAEAFRVSGEIEEARRTGASSGVVAIRRRDNYSYLDINGATVEILSDKLTNHVLSDRGYFLQPDAVLFPDQDGKHVYLIGNAKSKSSPARHEFVQGTPPPDWRRARGLGERQVHRDFWETDTGSVLVDVEIASDLFISRGGSFAFFDKKGGLRLWGESPAPEAPLEGFASIYAGSGLPPIMIGDSLGEFVFLTYRGKAGFFHVDSQKFVSLQPEVLELIRSNKGFGSNYKFLPNGLLVSTISGDKDFVDRVFVVDPASGGLTGKPVELQMGFGLVHDVLSNDELLIDSSVVNLHTGKTRLVFSNPSGFVRGATAGPPNSSGTSGYVFLVTTGGLDIYNTAKPDRLATLNMSGMGSWIIATPAGFYAAGGDGDRYLRVAYGIETVLPIDKFRDALYRPDLVAEALKGDPEGLVKAAAAKVSLEKILQSGSAPEIVIKGEQAGGVVKASAAIEDGGGGIGRIEWRVNGVVQQTEEGMTADVAELFLASGENRIELVAYNRDNTIQGRSEPLTFELDDAQVSPSRLFVLAAGVDKYELDALQLKYAVGDATRVAAAFEKAGAGLYGEVFTEVLADSQVTRANLEAKFRELAKSVRPNDVFVFFSAGHGKTVDGRFFFIPQDFAGSTAASIREQGIGHSTWQDWFSLIPAQKSLLMFDSCESGSLTETVVGRELRFRAANDFLGNATGRALIAASSGTGVALEGYQDQGVFAWSAIEALSLADRDANGLIDIDELAASIEETVPRIAREAFGEDQTPQFKAPMKGFDVVRPIGRL